MGSFGSVDAKCAFVGLVRGGSIYRGPCVGARRQRHLPKKTTCGVLHLPTPTTTTPRRLYDVSVVTTKLYSNRCINIEVPSPCCKLLM
jgi:hypothetical protein